jgi:hypothetical protein
MTDEDMEFKPTDYEREWERAYAEMVRITRELSEREITLIGIAYVGVMLTGTALGNIELANIKKGRPNRKLMKRKLKRLQTMMTDIAYETVDGESESLASVPIAQH